MNQFSKLHIPLRCAADRAIFLAWRNGNFHQRRFREDLYVKNLINHAIPMIDSYWKKIFLQFGRISCQVRGVVCHGQPVVKFPSATRGCELGDLLLVHDHYPKPGIIQRRAALVQAKKFKNGRVQSQNPTQLHLYTKWPPFTYTKWPGGISSLRNLHQSVGFSEPPSSALDRDIWKVPRGQTNPRRVDQGCRYGMIDLQYKNWHPPIGGRNPWRLCSAQVPNLYQTLAGDRLGSYMAQLVARKVGREAPQTRWPRSLNGACHWSLVVMELLSLSKNTSGNPANQTTSPSLQTTGSTPSSGSVSSAPLRYMGRDDLPDPPVFASEDEKGFGVIQIVTSIEFDDSGPRSEPEEDA